MNRILVILAATLLLASSMALHAQAPTSAVPSPVCLSAARVCLDHTLNTYLKALLVHKPQALPLAENVTFVENGVEMKLGEGLWNTITDFNVSFDGGIKQEFIDEPRGSAGLYTVAMEGKTPVLFALRIQVVDRKITDVDTIVVRSPQPGIPFEPGSLHGASRAMNAVPSKELLPTREEAIAISEHYLQGLKSGSFAAPDTLFASDAYRMQNGRTTTGTVLAQGTTALSKLTYKIEAVDEDLGLVLLREDHGSGSAINANETRVTWEGLKIYGGQIHAIEGFCGIVASTM